MRCAWWQRKAIFKIAKLFQIMVLDLIKRILSPFFRWHIDICHRAMSFIIITNISDWQKNFRMTTHIQWPPALYPILVETSGWMAEWPTDKNLNHNLYFCQWETRIRGTQSVGKNTNRFVTYITYLTYFIFCHFCQTRNVKFLINQVSFRCCFAPFLYTMWIRCSRLAPSFRLYFSSFLLIACIRIQRGRMVNPHLYLRLLLYI